MPPKKDRTSASASGSASKKSVKSTEDSHDADTSLPSSSPAPKTKGKQSEVSNQPTLDKHLISYTNADELNDILKNFSNKLNGLASQEYIESKFKQMITEDLLSQKLKELENVIKLKVQKELDSVRKEMKVVNDRVKSMEDVVETLRNKVSDLEVKVDQLQVENTQLLKKNDSLLEKVNEREIKIKSLDAKNNNLEQYTRRNSIRIYGVADDVNESYSDTCKKVMKLVNEKLRIKVEYADIDIAHRIGRFQPDGNRPIICKFVQRYFKNDVVKARRMLKGTTYIIREDLTHVNAKLLEDVSSNDKVKVAWSDEGRIVALLKNDKKFVVSRISDLDHVTVETPVRNVPLTTASRTPSTINN